MTRFFCINGSQRYYLERMRGLCKRRLKISGTFLIKFLFLGLNFAKVPLICCFSFSYTFCQIICLDILVMNIYMLIKSLATRTWYSWAMGSLWGWDPVKPEKPPSIFNTDRSKALLLLWFLTVTCSCCPYLYFSSAIMLVTYFIKV